MSAKRVLILWDDGNLEHATRHGVTWQEIEDVLRSPRRITEPAKRSREKRVATIGRTPARKIVVIILTARAGGLRPISARPAEKGEIARFREWEGRR